MNLYEVIRPAHVNLSETDEPDVYHLTVVDDCEGIPLDILQNHVFKLGKLPLPDSPHLREHGFGLKNVLAKIEAVKGSWEMWTRDERVLDDSKCYCIKNPLKYRIPIDSRPWTDWPSYGPQKMGTIVTLKVPLSFLQTVMRGIRGRPPKTIAGIVDYFKEHLGVFYRGYLEGRKSIGTIKPSINWGSSDEVELHQNQIFLIEGKHTKSTNLPSLGDIKDGLLRMILLTNLEDVKINGRIYCPIPVLKLTTGPKFRINSMTRNQETVVENLKKESVANSFKVMINTNYIT